ncbi:MAG: O-antigen ligase family protein [Bdellovibrionaceae bacterium]|nr:O-antigen ligase family protein [Pseudobdellovibrionaceae bacterium]
MKSFLVYLAGGLCFFTLAFHKDRHFNIPISPWKWLAGFFIGLQILYGFIFDFPLGLFFLPKFLSLVGLILFFCLIKLDLATFFKKREWLILAFFGVLFVLTSRDFVMQIMNEGLHYQAVLFIHPFGNVNMLAEFYLLCVPLLYFWITQKNEIAKSVKVVAFILVHVVLIATKSRSAYFGLGLWWIFWLYQSPYQLRMKVFVSASFLAILTLGTFAYKSDLALATNKNMSSRERTNFYRSAIDLILDRPLGIGAQFSNQIVPYRLSYPVGPTEFEYPDQPHSEILKWGVEFGWVGLIMSLLCIVLMTHQIATKGSFLLKGAGLVLLPQLLFQFPFENPATIIMLAIYFYLFVQSLPQETVKWRKQFKVLSFMVGVGVIYYSIIFIGSIYLESNYPHSLEKTTQACFWNPSYLRGCVRKNYNLLQSHLYADLKKSLKKDMRLNYYAADYLKILSETVSEAHLEPDLVMQDESLTSISVYGSIDLQSRTIEKTCQIQHIYVFIYKNQQHYSEDDAKACENIAAPFDLKIPPLEFDREYKSWLATLLN